MKTFGHKNCMSNRSLKSINRSKYNKVAMEKVAPNEEDHYVIRRDGWRRKDWR